MMVIVTESGGVRTARGWLSLADRRRLVEGGDDRGIEKFLRRRAHSSRRRPAPRERRSGECNCYVCAFMFDLVSLKNYCAAKSEHKRI